MSLYALYTAKIMPVAEHVALGRITAGPAYIGEYVWVYGRFSDTIGDTVHVQFGDLTTTRTVYIPGYGNETHRVCNAIRVVSEGTRCYYTEFAYDSATGSIIQRMFKLLDSGYGHIAVNFGDRTLNANIHNETAGRWQYWTNYGAKTAITRQFAPLQIYRGAGSGEITTRLLADFNTALATNYIDPFQYRRYRLPIMLKNHSGADYLYYKAVTGVVDLRIYQATITNADHDAIVRYDPGSKSTYTFYDSTSVKIIGTGATDSHQQVGIYADNQSSIVGTLTRQYTFATPNSGPTVTLRLYETYDSNHRLTNVSYDAAATGYTFQSTSLAHASARRHSLV